MGKRIQTLLHYIHTALTAIATIQSWQVHDVHFLISVGVIQYIMSVVGNKKNNHNVLLISHLCH